jgi:feruloyl esterase
LLKNDGKLIIYHGWADVWANPEPTLDYYKDVVETTFGGDIDAAREKVQLFMAPGMDHCRGGPGPNSWDKLAPLVEWVENGRAPDSIIATHSTDGVVDNERPICAYPHRAVYTGPAGGQNDPANWVASNFTCQ